MNPSNLAETMNGIPNSPQSPDDDDVSLFILGKYKYNVIQVEVKNNI